MEMNKTIMKHLGRICYKMAKYFAVLVVCVFIYNAVWFYIDAKPDSAIHNYTRHYFEFPQYVVADPERGDAEVYSDGCCYNRQDDEYWGIDTLYLSCDKCFIYVNNWLGIKTHFSIAPISNYAISTKDRDYFKLVDKYDEVRLERLNPR